MTAGGVLPPAATLGGAPRTVNGFVLIGVPSGPAAGWISQPAERDFPTRRMALSAGSLSGLLNGSVVRVTAANAAVFARTGPAERPAARLVWSVLMDDPGCLRASPDPHHVTLVRQSTDAFPCRSLRRSRRASRQSSATRSVSAPDLMAARSSRLGHSGSNSPGRRYESSRHGLAASRPRTLGSGAVR